MAGRMPAPRTPNAFMNFSVTGQLADRIRRCADKIGPEIRRVRRYLHQHPELSEAEYQTTEFLCREVDQLGLKSSIAGDGRDVY